MIALKENDRIENSDAMMHPGTFLFSFSVECLKSKRLIQISLVGVGSIKEKAYKK
jgi:hypothetical protein